MPGDVNVVCTYIAASDCAYVACDADSSRPCGGG
jgi:hypothetical protein